MAANALGSMEDVDRFDMKLLFIRIECLVRWLPVAALNALGVGRA